MQKKYRLGENSYALDVSMRAIHYKDNYSNKQEPWKDINLNFKNNQITQALVSSILVCVIVAFSFLAGCSTQTDDIQGSSVQVSNTSNSNYTVDFPDTAGDVPDAKFEIAITQSDLPEKLKIYKMVKPQITTEYVKDLATKFGLTGEINQGNGGFSIQDKETGATLGIYPLTGTIDYSIDSKLFPEEKPTLPSDEEAKKIAMEFLSKRGLLPEGDVASNIYVGRAGYGPAHLLVGFTHTINITGPGAKHGVRIGNNGKVIEVFINPTNPLNCPVQEIRSAKSINEACQEMQIDKKYRMPSEARKIKITEVKIAYWLEPIDKGQEYIVPVYILGGQCFDNSDKQVGKFTGYAQAVN